MALDGLVISPEKPVYSEPYRDALAYAASSGKPIMVKLLLSLQSFLERQQLQVGDLLAREQLDGSLTLLRLHKDTLKERFSSALLDAFVEPIRAAKAATAQVQKQRFDRLELMPLDQVQHGVVLARVLQSIKLTVDVALVELNTYVCASLGLSSVRPESNPFRPEIFVQALQRAMSGCGISNGIQLDWIQQGSGLLGRELDGLYGMLSQRFRASGVAAVGFAIVRGPDAPKEGQKEKDRGTPEGGVDLFQLDNGANQRQLILTLDKLQRLLAGDLAEEHGTAGNQGSDIALSSDFVGIFDSSQKLTTSTNLSQYSEVHPHPAAAVGQEVVRLLLDNVAHDGRLLEPVQELVRSLEPALLRLAAVDPSFFGDKQHPARLLLDEVTRLSFAYPSIQSPGFARFLGEAQASIGPVINRNVDIGPDAAPFEQALSELTLVNQPSTLLEALLRQDAMEALQKAEQRNLLAEKLGKEMGRNPQLANVPKVIVDFLSGPWAQVVAHVQLNDKSGVADPGSVHASIDTLIWSAQPDLARKSIGKLVRLLPKLLHNLRQGLALVQYPASKTEAFFEALFVLHQQAFKPIVAKGPGIDVVAVEPQLTEEPWIGPIEAAVSGFMEDVSGNLMAMSVETPPSIHADQGMVIGDWAEILADGQWSRTQLTWTTPHGTMFLFTDARGHCLSMTKRSYTKRLADGTMREVQAHMVVDDALDAVSQLAMRNSIDNILI
jgi:hypothetical protein